MIKKLHQISDNQVHLTVQYMNTMARYLHSTSRDPSYQIQYSLLYAYVSQYLNGRRNSFQLHTFNGLQTGIIITNNSIEQNIWISRINMVIRHLITRKLNQLNQRFLSSEQVLYASWIYERVINPNEDHLSEWRAVFLVLKGSELYIFNENQTPPFSTHDFICCKRIYSIIEIFIETISFKDRPYSFLLTLPTDLRYLNFERKTEYEDFISSYQRSLNISVYSIENRTFGCLYQGEICRLILDINKGFEMIHNQTNDILWLFTFEQLQSSSDNGQDRIFFQFKHYFNQSTIHLEVQCQDLRILVHVINAFLTVKFLGLN